MSPNSEELPDELLGDANLLPLDAAPLAATELALAPPNVLAAQ